MPVMVESDALLLLIAGEPLSKGGEWLRSCHRRTSQGVGWPHLAPDHEPTVWGGTLDGLRGCVAAGINPLDPIIKDSIEWLNSIQREDGSWSSREIQYSCVEATAWVVIALKETYGGETGALPSLVKARDFLLSAIQEGGEVATSKDDLDQIRTYPSLLTLWALSSLSDKSTNIARYLKDIVAVEGGWGFKQGMPPNPVTTAQVLCALLVSQQIHPGDPVAVRAISYLREMQNLDGSWRNTSESWFSKSQPTIPNRCDDYGTSWTLQALFRAGLSVTDPAVEKGLRWLIEEQRPEGYWIFAREDNLQHVWCTSESLVALGLARATILRSTVDILSSISHQSRDVAALELSPPTRDPILNQISRETPGHRVQSITLTVLTLYTFRVYITEAIIASIHYVDKNADAVAVGVIATAVYSAIGASFLWLSRSFRKGRSK